MADGGYDGVYSAQTLQLESRATQPPVVVTQPGIVTQTTVMVAPAQRPWTSGICDCFNDCGSCMCGWCCTPCLICSVSTRLGENACVAFCCQGGLLALRTKLRTMYGIHGSICDDGCLIMCCTVCVLCQMDRELKAMGVP